MTPVPAALHDAALEAYAAALAAVDPTVLVRKAVRQGLLDDWLFDAGTPREKPKSIQVLALGKAAPRMLWGLVEAGVHFRGFGVAPKGVPAPNVDTFRWLPGDHPVPGDASFAAGRALLDWVATLPADQPVLVLLSGGASACVEHPIDLSQQELRVKWKEWLNAGWTIEALNAQRAHHSALKGGKLGRLLLERTPRVRVWILADTDPAAAAATVGSAPFHQPEHPEAISHHVLAGNGEAVAAAGLRLASLGFDVYRHARRVGDDVAGEIAAFLAAADGLAGQAALVGGGEATVRVPADAPPGGRNQHAALLAAQWLHAHKSALAFLAVGTDGIDGTTDAAGALVTAADWAEGAEDAVRHFDAHRYLDRRGRLLHLGATGTNVNDLWVALRSQP